MNTINLGCFLAMPSFTEHQKLNQVLWCGLHLLAISDEFASAQHLAKSR